MSVEFVVAMSENRVIGHNNALPWHIPEDLAFFKEITMGHPMVMGRKTYESIGTLLPGRDSVIISRQREYVVPGAIVVSTVDAAMEAAAQSPTGKKSDAIMVIGGAEIFEATLHLADVIHLTLVHDDYEGDTVFPELDAAAWRETLWRELPPGPDQPAVSFIRLVRAAA